MSATTAPLPLPAVRHEIIGRLHRIEGQVRGIERMIEQDRYCIDVLTQVAAASRALQGVALALLEDHIRECLSSAGNGPGLPEAKVKEASEAIARLVHI
jgi:DNA-binding FrmR family transcriptional regulator